MSTLLTGLITLCKESAWQNMLLLSGMFYIPQIPQGKLWWWQQHLQWKINCHLRLSFPLSYSFFICTYKHFSYKHRWHIESSFSLLSTEQARWLCLYFRAAVMLLRSFSHPMTGWWWFVVAEQPQCFTPLSVEWLMLCLPCSRTWSSSLMTVNSRGWASAPQDVSMCWSSRPDPRDCSSGCRWEKDASQPLQRRRNGDHLNVCHLCLFVCRLMDI